MEKETKAIGISALITMGLISLSMMGVNFFDEPQYYCESRGLIQECNSLSGGKETRCYLNNEQDSWLVCSEGWIPIKNDIQEEPKEPEPKLNPTQKTGVWGTKYNCDSQGCSLIN